MPVSARANYALRAAIELAAAPGSHVTIKELARAQIVTDRFLETIMTHLRRGNIVRKRGSDGGFWLARPATEISVADIIRAIDGQLPSVRGEPPDNVTYPGAAEPLRRVWVALHAFGPTVLETVTLADIVSGELWLPGRAPSGFGEGLQRPDGERREAPGCRYRSGRRRGTDAPVGHEDED